MKPGLRTGYVAVRSNDPAHECALEAADCVDLIWNMRGRSWPDRNANAAIGICNRIAVVDTRCLQVLVPEIVNV